MIKMVKKHLLAVNMKTEEEIIESRGKKRQLATSDTVNKKKNFWYATISNLYILLVIIHDNKQLQHWTITKSNRLSIIKQHAKVAENGSPVLLVTAIKSYDAFEIDRIAVTERNKVK